MKKMNKTTVENQNRLIDLVNDKPIETDSRVFDTKGWHYYVIFKYEGDVYDLPIEPVEVAGDYLPYYGWDSPVSHETLFEIYHAVKHGVIELDCMVMRNGKTLTPRQFKQYVRYLMYTGR